MRVALALMLLPAVASAFDYAAQRAAMVATQLKARDIDDPRVLAAMAKVPRHAFVPPLLRRRAYEDNPLPIEHRQTISQPYIVALMTQAAQVTRDARVLDVGTGSGYQAAVLAELAEHVHSIEILCPLAESAKARLAQLNYTNVTVACGDGYAGWKAHAPFDVIIVAAAPQRVPPPLIHQLAVGGRLVMPVGDRSQHLLLLVKQPDGTVRQRKLLDVRFVPMTGAALE